MKGGFRGKKTTTRNQILKVFCTLVQHIDILKCFQSLYNVHQRLCCHAPRKQLALSILQVINQIVFFNFNIAKFNLSVTYILNSTNLFVIECFQCMSSMLPPNIFESQNIQCCLLSFISFSYRWLRNIESYFIPILHIFVEEKKSLIMLIYFLNSLKNIENE